MKKIFIVILIITPIILSNCITYKIQNSQENSIDDSIIINGIERTFHLYIPSIYNDKKNVPLLIVLHGLGGAGKGIEKKTTLGGFDKLAEEKGFIVVYPDGFNRKWTCYVRANIDDVKFISRLIDYLRDKYRINKKRIYITGMSNGGVMAFCLACKLSDKISAIATVAASMPENLYKNCQPKRNVSVLIIHGMDDPIVPWNGGDVIIFKRYRGRVVSIWKTVEFWVNYNNCTLQSKQYLPDLDPNDGTRVWVKKYVNKENNIKVVLYGIKGGGHTWPGGSTRLRRITGNISHDINACKIIWNFFEKIVR